MEAACPHHPDVPALGSCQRCGTFFCAQDRVDVDGVAYCQTCGVRPDVDWLEAYRKKYLGRRDGFGWMMGFVAIVWTFVSASMAATFQGAARLYALPALASAIAAALFFFGKPIARALVLITALLWGALLVVASGPLMVIPTMLGLAVFGAPQLAPRNRLFFRLHVPREKLRRDYERLADNLLARNAMALGAISLLLPPIALIAIPAGIIAWRKVDPAARPPVGKGGHAIAGIVFGAFGLAIGGFWVALLTNR